MTDPVIIGDDDPVNEFIYFVSSQATNTVKIGYSSNLPKRFIDLQTSSSTQLMLILRFRGNRATERQIHEQLKEHRKFGEWFADGPDVETLIDEISDFICHDDDGKDPWDHFVSDEDVRRIVASSNFGRAQQ